MKIIKWKTLTEFERTDILQRPSQKDDRNRRQCVEKIISQVKSKGDAALYQLTQQLDKASLKNLYVNKKEIEQAEKILNSENKVAIKFAIERIAQYQTALKPKSILIETIKGVVCERVPRAIENVGLYVPGGNTPLISTAMMLALPAKIAECKKRILCTPPKPDGSIDPYLLFTAKQCGIETIYKIGGAQAIAAMAYGTETIPKVDKIFGPGNAWVTEAKQQVAQDTFGAQIDMPAGPSEVLIIADNNATPEFVAADLLSQAEHGTDSQVIVIVFTETMGQFILNAIENQLRDLSRKSIVQQSLANSQCIIADTMDNAILISNLYAPEHLILQIENPETVIKDITNAGAVFVGPWAPETVGDYVTGSNHVLPTNSYARSNSGLSVLDFIKFISIQRITETGLKNISSSAKCLANLEGLQAHKNAVSLREEKIYDNVF